jgi:hypothetical protein
MNSASALMTSHNIVFPIMTSLNSSSANNLFENEHLAVLDYSVGYVVAGVAGW